MNWEIECGRTTRNQVYKKKKKRCSSSSSTQCDVLLYILLYAAVFFFLIWLPTESKQPEPSPPPPFLIFYFYFFFFLKGKNKQTNKQTKVESNTLHTIKWYAQFPWIYIYIYTRAFICCLSIHLFMIWNVVLQESYTIPWCIHFDFIGSGSI